MGSGFLYVVAPGSSYPLGQGVIHWSNYPAWNSHDKRPGRHLHPFRDDRTSRNDTAGSDRYPVEQYASHRDETIVTYRTTVQDDPMADPNPLPYRAGDAFVDVHDGAILYVGLCPDDDGGHIASEHRVVPDAGVFPQ
jgi:hypothetical protein